MSASPASSKPTTLLILGAAGDLTERLLLPGLGTLLKNDPGRKVTVVGADRVDLTERRWASLVDKALSSAGLRKPSATAMAKKARYVQADLLDRDQLRDLLESCGDGPLVIYFALPPSITSRVCENLEGMPLPDETRLGLEKPFGNDTRSAGALNRRLLKLVPENHIHRVDHFLGHATVLNLVGVRFANRLFEPVWNADNIDRVEILYDEDLALEGRAGYYDGAGALRDMLQSHLLLVLAFFAMEPPASLDEEELRSALAQVLRSTRVWGDDPVASSRRARYTGGTIGRRKVPAYTKEPGVDPSRKTETLAELTVEVDNQRWKGVPFCLRSGKALGVKRKQLIVYFKEARHIPRGFIGREYADQIIFTFQPDSIRLSITTNGAGDPFDLEQAVMDVQMGSPQMKPYGEVLAGIFDGDPTLSIRGDAAERCWQIVGPVVRAWENDEVPLETYRAGSGGPRDWSTHPDA